MTRDFCEFPNIEGGYVMLARKTVYSSLFQMPPNDYKLASLCIMMANHQDGKWWDDYAQEEVLIKRGSFITSIRKLAGLTGLTEKTVRTSLARLEKVEFLSRKVVKWAQQSKRPITAPRAQRWAHRYSLVTVVKYDYYNNPENYTAQKTAQLQTCAHSKSGAEPLPQPLPQPLPPNNKRRREESTPQRGVIITPGPPDVETVRRFYKLLGVGVLPDDLLSRGALTCASLRATFKSHNVSEAEFEQAVDEIASNPSAYRGKGQEVPKHFGIVPYVIDQAFKRIRSNAGGAKQRPGLRVVPGSQDDAAPSNGTSGTKDGTPLYDGVLNQAQFNVKHAEDDARLARGRDVFSTFSNSKINEMTACAQSALRAQKIPPDLIEGFALRQIHWELGAEGVNVDSSSQDVKKDHPPGE